MKLNKFLIKNGYLTERMKFYGGNEDYFSRVKKSNTSISEFLNEIIINHLDKAFGIIDNRLDNENSDIAELSRILTDFYDILKDMSEELDTNDVDDWKDIILANLPAKSSSNFANDVEEALSNIRKVY